MDYIAVTDNNESPLSEEDFNIFYADYESSVDEEEEEEEEVDVDCDYETMTVKQLLRIRDYYNIPKSGKVPKKSDIIDAVVVFESNIDNIDIVIRRNKMWKYIDVLKSDKFMKQFVFWS